MYHHTSIRLTDAERADAIALIEQFDILHGPGESRFSLSEQTIEAFRPVLNRVLPGRWVQAHLVALYASQQIVGHQDASIAPATRYHIALVNNAGCWCWHAGEWSQLALGSLYYMDPQQPHGAVNWGDSTRVHLMVDIDA